MPNYIDIAKEDDLEGITCGHCGKENDFADEIGWWYCCQEEEARPCLPTCRDCYYGAVGTLHQERYGVGDR